MSFWPAILTAILLAGPPQEPDIESLVTLLHSDDLEERERRRMTAREPFTPRATRSMAGRFCRRDQSDDHLYHGFRDDRDDPPTSASSPSDQGIAAAGYAVGSSESPEWQSEGWACTFTT
jgi:hypothetical protein